MAGQRQSFRPKRSQRGQKLQTASLHLRASERAIQPTHQRMLSEPALRNAAMRACPSMSAAAALMSTPRQRQQVGHRKHQLACYPSRPCSVPGLLEPARHAVPGMEALLERHVLKGLLDAPWVRTDDAESDDDRFFAALQELVAYTFEESVRIKKTSRLFPGWHEIPARVISRNSAGSAVFASEVSQRVSQAIPPARSRRSRVIRAHQPGSEPIDIPETIPNPVVVPKRTPTPTEPAPKEPVRIPGEGSLTFAVMRWRPRNGSRLADDSIPTRGRWVSGSCVYSPHLEFVAR